MAALDEYDPTPREILTAKRFSLYHCTRKSNLKSIFDKGLLCWSAALEQGVPEDALSSDYYCRTVDAKKGLEKYVRLSFIPDHPMVATMVKDNRAREREFLNLVIDLSVLDIPGVLFSDRNAAAADAVIRPGTDHLNFTVLTSGGFQKYVPKAYKPFRQAEILIPECIPVHMLRLGGVALYGQVPAIHMPIPESLLDPEKAARGKKKTVVVVKESHKEEGEVVEEVEEPRKEEVEEAVEEKSQKEEEVVEEVERLSHASQES